MNNEALNDIIKRNTYIINLMLPFIYICLLTY